MLRLEKRIEYIKFLLTSVFNKKINVFHKQNWKNIKKKKYKYFYKSNLFNSFCR